MTVDEPVKKMILSYLSKWKTTRVNKERLKELQEDLMKKFEYRTLPLITIKKWIRSVVKETKQSEKLKQIRYEPASITAPMSDRTFQQTLTFDLAAMKKTVERTAGQLNTLNDEMEKNKAFAKTAAPEIAAIRKIYERISAKLDEIERKIIVR